jgi:hypothetical protein
MISLEGVAMPVCSKKGLGVLLNSFVWILLVFSVNYEEAL